MKIALCQFTSGLDKAANLAAVLDWTHRASDGGADLIVLPEYVMYHANGSETPMDGIAEPLDGPFVSALAEVAAQRGIWVICNVFEESDDHRPFNTSIVLDRTGRLVGSYRKAHLYDAFGFAESDYIRPTDSPCPLVVSIEGFSVGVLICYDLRFPEFARANVDAGADLLVYSAGWPIGPRKDDHWNVMLRSRAIENTCFVAGVVQGPPLATGGTLLVDPMGAIEGELADEDGLIVRNIDPARVSRVRSVNPSLTHRVL